MKWRSGPRRRQRAVFESLMVLRCFCRKVRVQHVHEGLLMRPLETKTCMVAVGRLRVIGCACMLPACLYPPQLSRSWACHAVQPARAAMLGHCLGGVGFQQLAGFVVHLQITSTTWSRRAGLSTKACSLSAANLHRHVRFQPLPVDRKRPTVGRVHSSQAMDPNPVDEANAGWPNLPLPGIPQLDEHGI
ncbi:hypothetical protein E4T42_06744 [Aureobasidium subglaciale]|nr:hypothetical protein E4T42_06744 [Aureobasidium subglaciale]